MTRDNAQALLRTAVNNPSANFKDGQWEAIEALVFQRRRLLVVQRTGWGKSMVYFLATRLLREQGRGPSIIISPLLALMRNQIDAARRIGVEAITINSTNYDQADELAAKVHANQVDCLLVSPEKLANDAFVEEVLGPILDTVSLLVVDEAHCISDWGHDFRPDYRRLLNILQRMPPNLPVLGTTATANDRVINDVVAQLGDVEVLRGPLLRSSLALQNIVLPDQGSRLAWLAERIPELPGTGIVYVLTKRDALQVRDWLVSRGINAAAYFSGVKHDAFGDDSNAYRQHLEDQLLKNSLKVLVATTALGMGYDKPDLAFVIHYQAIGSIVSYYQQVGRAGRGIEHAFGFLMSGREDEEIHAYFRRSAFPHEKQVQRVLEVLDESDGLTIRELEKSLNMRYGQIDKVLKFVSVENPSPVYKQGLKWVRTAVAYQMDRERIARLTQMREQEWQEIQDYIATDGCLMEFLGRALDDAEAGPCGKCANCVGQSLVALTPSDEMVRQAYQFIRHSEFPVETNKQVAPDAFPEYGFHGNLPAQLCAVEGRILSRWNDAAWGRMVADDKHAGRFRDELVDAMAAMITDRWQPQPAPQWVTCVPSLRHPELVPDFAQRLAVKLGLPFLPVIKKVKDNPQQKLQENRYHQCHNLDGVFAIMEGIRPEPVLLLDDVIDSGWTITVLAALLRQHGSGAVYPVALASTATGN